MINACIILLAGGASTRMGAPKPLLKFKNTTWLEHQIESLKSLKPHALVVVLGYAADEILNKVSSKVLSNNVQICINPNPERGQFSSIQCGIKAAVAQATDKVIFILPIDVPAPKNEVWRALYEEAERSDIVQPEYLGKGGHPIVLSSKMTQKILRADSSSRLDSLVKLEKNKKRLAVEDAQVTMNLNTPEEFKNYLTNVEASLPPQ